MLETSLSTQRWRLYPQYSSAELNLDLYIDADDIECGVETWMK
jgi:hypothetical protein